jgi:hypothetical protein
MVICVVADDFCVDADFTSGVGECLYTNGLYFGCLVAMSSSVLYRGLRELRFQILRRI